MTFSDSSALMSSSPLLVERSSRLLQAQHVQQVVVAAARIVGLGLEQALPGLENVDGRARPDLVACFGCLQCGLRRFDRLLERLHAGNLGVDAEIGIARRTLGLARRALEPFARGVFRYCAWRTREFVRPPAKIGTVTCSP